MIENRKCRYTEAKVPSLISHAMYNSIFIDMSAETGYVYPQVISLQQVKYGLNIIQTHAFYLYKKNTDMTKIPEILD